MNHYQFGGNYNVKLPSVFCWRRYWNWDLQNVTFNCLSFAVLGADGESDKPSEWCYLIRSPSRDVGSQKFPTDDWNPELANTLGAQLPTRLCNLLLRPKQSYLFVLGEKNRNFMCADICSAVLVSRFIDKRHLSCPMDRYQNELSHYQASAPMKVILCFQRN